MLDLLWRRGRTPPTPADPSDRVVPLGFFETNPLVQWANVAVTLVFDDALDPAALRDALEAVVRQPGWQRLGGRLRRNPATGATEWHIPTAFTRARPALTFTHVAHPGPPPAAIPRPTRRPAVVSDPDALADLAWGPAYRPTAGAREYLDTDTPVLGLRITTFAGATTTVVALRWQHTAFDALGLQAVVGAWAAALHGQHRRIPAPVADDVDPFARLGLGGGAGNTERHVLAHRRAGWPAVLRWGLRCGADMLLRGKENRMVCVPAASWAPALRAAAAGGAFVTENDVITAFIARCVVAAEDMRPDRTVNISIAMSLRKAFAGAALPPREEEHPYIGNAFGWAHVLARAGDVQRKPLGWLAREVRRAINEQGTRAQHEAYYAAARGLRLPINVFGDGGMAQLGFSNWTKAGLFDLDFAPARTGTAGATGACRPRYVQENHGPVKPVDGWFILGKDGEGNYWASAYKVQGQWARLEQYLQREYGEADKA